MHRAARNTVTGIVLVFAITMMMASMLQNVSASVLPSKPSGPPSPYLSNTATAHASTVIEYREDNAPSGITVHETVTLMGEIAALYQPEVLKNGALFAWDFDWTKPWLGAGSRLDVVDSKDAIDSELRTFAIMLWGGFARADAMTLRALEFTLCHEFGHFLGGNPHQVFAGNIDDWSSSEGQSDWWAATVCLPRLYRARGLSDIAVRDRILGAGLDFVRFAEFHFDKAIDPATGRRLTEPATLERSAPETPPETLTLAYPSTQCRLDTVRLGAACAVGQSCERPRCWFVSP